MAIAAGIAIIIGCARSVVEIARTLNGWHVLASLGFVVLCALGIDNFLNWLKAQFAALRREEGENRGGEHEWVLRELQNRDDRLKKLEALKNDFIRPA